MKSRLSVFAIFSSLLVSQLAWGSAHGGNAPDPGVRSPSTKIIREISRQQRRLILHESAFRKARAALRRELHVYSAAPATHTLLSSEGFLSFDYAQQKVKTQTIFTIRAESDGLSRINVYYSDNLDSSVTAQDPTGPLTVEAGAYGIIAVTLRTPLKTGEVIAITVGQEGKADCANGFLGILPCQIEENFTFNIMSAWQPLLYDVDNEEVLSPQASTLSVTVPPTKVVAASGFLTSETVDPTTQNKIFTFSDAQGEGFSMATAAFEVGATTFGEQKEKTVHSYIMPDIAKNSAAWRDVAVEALNFHAARYGAYDYPKADFVQIPDDVGAGLGPRATVFIPASLLRADPVKRSYATYMMAHELSHQWFGNMIQLGENYSPWMNEGFATFAEGEFLADRLGKNDGENYGPRMRQMTLLNYVYSVLGAKEPPMSSGSIFRADNQVYVGVTYYKGGMFVNMLRYLLGGDEPFFKMMKSYKEAAQGKRVTVNSLIEAIKSSTGQDLSAMITRWISKAGFPIYDVHLTRSGSEGKYRADLTLSTDDDYRIPVEVEFVLANGQKLLRQVQLNGKSGTLTEVSDSEIIQVRVDPQSQIICRSRGALAGDMVLNGAVDGMDLIWTAWAQGQSIYQDSAGHNDQGFSSSLDVILDGNIDEKDLALVLDNFGRLEGEVN